MNWFTAKKWQTALELLLDLSKNGVLYYLWETFYVTVLATAFAMLLGLPLGILLVTGDEKGVLPLPRLVLRALNALINLLRSVPFLILMILVVPLTRPDRGQILRLGGLHRAAGGGGIPLCGASGGKQPA